MLTRIHVQGYKSLENCSVRPRMLTTLFGANATGKSNFLDALQLLSRIAVGPTLKDAFEPPYRGKPLETFTLGRDGLRGLLTRDRLAFSIEADLHLSDAVVEAVERDIRGLREPGRDDASEHRGTPSAWVRERDLRYRIEVEMMPRTGVLRVSDESLAALNRKGEPTRKRRPFLERQGEKIHLRHEGQSHPTYIERFLDRSILSMPHYAPHHPHLSAARRELEGWMFFYFEPRERMRTASPVKETRHIGAMGEDLASFLNMLKASNPNQFEGLEKALRSLIPSMEGIDIEISEIGEVELRLRENGIVVPARVVSEGTLRMLGLLALAGAHEAPTLVGLEEPENGIHPRRIELVAELLRTRRLLGPAQYIVTTHSPVLADHLPADSLYAVRRNHGRTCIDPVSSWGPLAKHVQIKDALTEATAEDPLPVSNRMMRGDFDA